MKEVNNLLKRVLDIIVSLTGLIILFPLFLIISLAIKIESKGPIFFKQGRLGRNGNVFKIWKFRSMVVNAENMGTGIFNYKDDPRVTKVGNFLRNTSLDEIPQLINILCGSMSVVGPRPPVTYELGSYDDFDDTLKKRFLVKPGVTGIAQVNGRNELSWDEKIEYDNIYVDKFYKWGILLDIKLIVVTFFKVLKNEGSHELEQNAEQDRSRIKETN